MSENNRSIADAQAAKNELEAEIGRLLLDFTERTGCEIRHVGVDTVRTHTDIAGYIARVEVNL